MLTSVTVDGVTLTRAQVEKAYKEINKPEGKWIPKPGDKFTTVDGGRVYVAMGAVAADLLNKGYYNNAPDTRPSVVVWAVALVDGCVAAFAHNHYTFYKCP